MGGFFWRKLFRWNVFGGIFREDFFGRIFWKDFLGGFFWEKYFLGGFFWEEFFRRNSLFTLLKFTLSYLNIEGIDLFVKILSQGKKEGRKSSILRSASASISYLKNIQAVPSIDFE